MTQRIRHALTWAFLACALAAFCYGATGCASAAERDPVPCPDRTAMKIRTIVQVEKCDDGQCEMLMVSCFVVPEGESWAGHKLP